MPTYVVTTWETVLGTYTVEAASEQDVRARFEHDGDKLIDWNGVEQVGYMAFDIEVKAISAR
jgi:hypothetical protein